MDFERSILFDILLRLQRRASPRLLALTQLLLDQFTPPSIPILFQYQLVTQVLLEILNSHTISISHKGNPARVNLMLLIIHILSNLRSIPTVSTANLRLKTSIINPANKDKLHNYLSTRKEPHLVILFVPLHQCTILLPDTQIHPTTTCIITPETRFMLSPQTPSGI